MSDNPFGTPDQQQPAASGNPFDAPASSVPQQAPPSALQQVGDAAGGALDSFGTGFAKGMGQTVNTASKLLNKIPVVGETLAPSQGVSAASTMETPHGTGEKVGVGAEALAEMLLGDSALKGLSLGDKLLQAGKVADYYEKASPFVRASIEHGMTGARVGAESGAEVKAKGGTNKEAAGAAATGFVAGAASGPVLQGAQRIWGTMTGKAIQDGVQAGVRSTLANVAEDAGVNAPKATLRTSADAVADQVESQAKGLYKQIDDATEGAFTNLQDRIKNVENKLRGTIGINDAEEARLENQLNAPGGLNERMEAAIEQAKAKGVDPSVVDQAKAKWKQMSALRDVDTQIKASIDGDGVHAPEIVDPKKLSDRMLKLKESGRLEQALGPKRANEMLKAAFDAKTAASGRAANLDHAKTALKLVGAGGVAAEGLRLLNQK